MTSRHGDQRPAWSRLLIPALAFLWTAFPTTGVAVEVDKYLPEDTEFVVNFNVRQVLDSRLVKSIGLDLAREALKSIDDVNDVLKDLGFDPFKDLDRIVLASPGGTDKDRGLMIVHGTYDLAKFKAKAEAVIKDQGDVLKIHKVADGLGGQHLIYEVNIPDQDLPLFVALASKSTLLASPGKDYVVEGLKRGKGQAVAALKNKDFQALLEKMDSTQSLSLAVVGSALNKTDFLLGLAKDLLESVDAIGGGITVDEDVKLELVGSLKTIGDAREAQKQIKNGVNQGLAILALIATQNRDLETAVDVLKTIRCTNKDKTVTLKAQINQEILDRLFKMEK